MKTVTTIVKERGERHASRKNDFCWLWKHTKSWGLVQEQNSHWRTCANFQSFSNYRRLRALQEQGVKLQKEYPCFGGCRNARSKSRARSGL